MNDFSKKIRTCCFSGHRKIPPEQYNEIARRLKEKLIKLIEEGYCYFCSGGALGFDTLVAQTVLELKNEYPHINLILVLPFLSQTRGWNESDVRMYEYIKEAADKYVYTSENYFNGCMQKRNRHLVDNSSVCVCYLTEEKGGTAYTVKYANSRNLRIINIAEK